MPTSNLKAKRTFDFEEGEILLINKEIGWTSFDVVKKVKDLIYPINAKVGHAGTLDPLADGLMIICTGKKTKQISNYQNLDKEYVGSFVIGAKRPSIDLETPISETFSIDNITHQNILNTSYKFLGELQQVPPEYSAIKINGIRSYTLARQGLQPELKKRDIFIRNFEITKIDLPLITFRVTCSKGTYIRSLVRDFAENLNNGAYLNNLTRTKIGSFKLQNSLTIQRLKEILDGA